MGNDVDVQADDLKGRPTLKYVGRKPPPTRRERQSGSILGPKWDGRDSFTVEEAGEILGLSRWAAYQAATRQEIPNLKVGARRIVPRHALEKLLAV